MDGAYHIFVRVDKTFTFCLLSLHLLVYGCTHDHAGVDYPGVYPRSIFRNGYQPTSVSRTVSLVTPPTVL